MDGSSRRKKKHHKGRRKRPAFSLRAGLATLTITLFFPTKGNGVCMKSTSLQHLCFGNHKKWQTSATCSHTPSTQPNNFIFQMHNTSCLWTAVTKQTWTRRPSQTNSFSAVQRRVEGGSSWGTGFFQLERVHLNFHKAQTAHAMLCLYWLTGSLDVEETGNNCAGKKEAPIL